jgi:BlaI family penicillinase repressor
LTYEKIRITLGAWLHDASPKSLIRRRFQPTPKSPFSRCCGARAPVPVREVHDALGKDSGYTSTLKLMQLMFEKRLVVRNERYRSHLYEARAPKEQTQRQIAGDLMKRAFDGSAKSLVLGALAAQPASSQDLDEIRSLLNELKERAKK